MALLLAAVLALTGLVVARPTQAAADSGDSFVTRCGIRFCLDGEEYFFAGANAYDMFTFGAGSGDTETQHMDKARIDASTASRSARASSTSSSTPPSTTSSSRPRPTACA
ncbi:hypothetical protein ABZ621_02250 [Streptomyces sp. NPDC007863]|uniref:hypothetical protein n=1 Tax=Streptomyces sp. NPDC007863 TaxID=3154894 RepID=UPI0033C1E28F